MEKGDNMEYTNELDLYYFSDKKPLLKIMKEYADYSCETWNSRSGMFGDCITVNYEISYDFDKLINNLSNIKEESKKLKAYKKCKAFRDAIDSIPDNYNEYKRYSDLIEWENGLGKTKEYGMVSDINFLLEYCRKEADSCNFHYDVKNDIRKTYSFQSMFSKNFKMPMFSLVEKNGWEREMWKWWIELKSEDDMKLLVDLNKRLIELGEIDQKIGKTSYHINFILQEMDNINFSSEACSYMSANNRLEGVLDKKYINNLIDMDNQSLFEALYKGGLKKIVIEK